MILRSAKPAGFALVMVVLAAHRAAAQAPAAHAPNFTVEKIAEGVYAVIRTEPPGYLFQSNSTFIVCDSDVIVVDPQFTLAATKEVIAALRTITSKPVTYVINTHSHEDHVVGNQVYRDEYPGVKFIAQNKGTKAAAE